MRIRFLLGAVPIALAAAVGLASPALAKGGGTGGGGGTTLPAAPCAYFESWTTSVQTPAGQTHPWVALQVGVFNSCRDEGAGAKIGPAVTETFTDTATGQWLGASTTFANLTHTTFTYYFDPSAPPPPSPRTITFTITRANGQVQDMRTTTADAIIASAIPAA